MSDWPETRKRLEQLATSSIVGADIHAALAEIDRLHAIRADVERLPRYAVHGDRPGTMIEWPHGEFLARDAVLAALETP